MKTDDLHFEGIFQRILEKMEGWKQYAFHLEAELFAKTEAFRLIQHKSHLKCFTPTEIRQLSADIHHVFKPLITDLKRSCSSLTDEDILFCCLARLGIASKNIGHCMGCASKQAVNQRRYRVKKKLKEAQSSQLIEMIF